LELQMSGPFATRLRANPTHNQVSGLAEYLRRKHPDKTAFAVAADTGLPVGSIKKWLAEETSPGLPALRELVRVYGAECLAAAFLGDVPAWIDDAVREQKRAEYEARIAALRNELDRL
jgi:hypothetical protein